jgi:hypothetical protein
VRQASGKTRSYYIDTFILLMTSERIGSTGPFIWESHIHNCCSTFFMMFSRNNTVRCDDYILYIYCFVRENIVNGSLQGAITILNGYLFFSPNNRKTLWTCLGHSRIIIIWIVIYRIVTIIMIMNYNSMSAWLP